MLEVNINTLKELSVSLIKKMDIHKNKTKEIKKIVNNISDGKTCVGMSCLYVLICIYFSYRTIILEF
jgi:hypothetical protein